MSNADDKPSRLTCISFQSAQEHSGFLRTPKFHITGFKAVDMALMLGVSKATVHRKLKDFKYLYFMDIDDKTLDDIIHNIKLQFQNSNYRLVLGHLKANH